MRFAALCSLVAVMLFSGCASYRWSNAVPADKRAVFVSAVRNESDVLELGSEVGRQIAREFQREGTYKLSRADECALEIQSSVKALPVTQLINTDRDSNNHRRSWNFKVVATVSFIDKSSGKVLIDNRKYEGYTSLYGDHDLLTAKRNASGRIAEDIARQIVDDASVLNWE